jgi:hypothetical protein
MKSMGFPNGKRLAAGRVRPKTGEEMDDTAALPRFVMQVSYSDVAEWTNFIHQHFKF